MKRILILVALSLFLGSTASAFQGGGGESTKKESNKKQADAKKNSTTQTQSPTQTSGQDARAPTGYSATVDKTEAVFTFPIKPKSLWYWYSGGLQYAWEVKVNNRSGSYHFGFSLIMPMGATPPGKGSFNELLNEGQFDIWKHKRNQATVVQVGRITGFSNPNQSKLTIKLVGAEVIDLLFSEKLPFLVFHTNELDRESSITVPVVYNSSPAMR